MYFIQNTNAINPLKNRGYAVLVVYDNTLELAKETAQKCIEQQIAYSSLDEKQKQEMKENFQEWAETVIHGFKKRLRESGRLI